MIEGQTGPQCAGRGVENSTTRQNSAVVPLEGRVGPPGTDHPYWIRDATSGRNRHVRRGTPSHKCRWFRKKKMRVDPGRQTRRIALRGQPPASVSATKCDEAANCRCVSIVAIEDRVRRLANDECDSFFIRRAALLERSRPSIRSLHRARPSRTMTRLRVSGG
jgi:hypothetical protein